MGLVNFVLGILVNIVLKLIGSSNNGLKFLWMVRNSSV